MTITPVSGKLKDDGDTLGKGDPYVKIKVGAKEKENKPNTDGGENPKWENKGMTFERTAATKIVEVSVWDEDIVSDDDLLGKGTFNIVDLCGDKECQKVVTVPLK